MAPRSQNDPIPLFVVSGHLNTDAIVKELKSAYDLDVHVSQNVMKKSGNDQVIMLTFRDDKTYLQEFLNNVAVIEDYLRVNDHAVGKTHSEFSVFDTNVHHDSDWINKSTS